MKLITWNCQMAFRNKAEHILEHKPDVLIVPECENPDKLKFKNELPIPNEIIWIGDNKNKGLGVFSFGEYKISFLDKHNSTIKNILPLKVITSAQCFSLFAVWANNPKDKDGAYIKQVWKAFDHYNPFIKDNKTILIGDFNSNTIWDKNHRTEHHSALVKKLEERNIFSVYHNFHTAIQGKENHSTFFMYRKREKPYHIDYCFASADFIEKLNCVEFGKYEDWNTLSDHMPLIITFDE